MIHHHNYEAVLKVGPHPRELEKLFVQWHPGNFEPFVDFLEDVKKQPHLPESAVERLLRIIVREGLFVDGEILSQMYGRPVRSYKQMYRFSGLELFVNAVVDDFLLPVATTEFDIQRILCIVGPRSSGRRYFVQGLADRMDDNGEELPCLTRSQMHANPLSLLYCIYDMATVAYRRGSSEGDRDGNVEPYINAVMKNLKIDSLVDYNNRFFISWCQQHNIEPSFAGLCRKVLEHKADSVNREVPTAIMLGLGLTHATAFTIGYPDPAVLLRLLQDPDPTLALAGYVITSFRTNSRHDRAVGFAEVPEVQPINWDRKLLIACDTDSSAVGRRKPNANLTGYLCQANRGILVASNAFHSGREFLTDLRDIQRQSLPWFSTEFFHEDLCPEVRPLGFDNVTIVHDDLQAFDGTGGKNRILGPALDDGSFKIVDDYKVVSYPVPGFR